MGYGGTDRELGVRGLQQVGVSGVEGVVNQGDLFMGVQTGAVAGALTGFSNTRRPCTVT